MKIAKRETDDPPRGLVDDSSSSLDDDSSDDSSWPMVESSNDEVDSTTEKLAQVSLISWKNETAAEDTAANDSTEEPICKDANCGKNGVLCRKCTEWKFRDFAQFKDAPQRTRGRFTPVPEDHSKGKQ